MKRFRMISTVAFAATLLQGAVPARAMMIYSTLGPGDSYSNNSAWGAGTGSASQTPAAPFTVDGGNNTFQSVEVAIFSDSPVTISLLSDANGLPGAVLEQMTILDALIPGGPTEIGLMTASSVLHPQLTAGTTYWIAVHGVFDTGWIWSSPGVKGLMAVSLNNGTSWIHVNGINTFPAFRVNGDPATAAVPEPSSLMLAALGVVSFAAIGWRKRRRTS